MKVLQVINSLNVGGAEKLLVDSIPIYQELGIDMDLLLLNGVDTPFLQDLKKRTNGKVFVLSINKYYDPRFIFGIIRYIKNYDLLHVHLFPALYFVSLAKFLSRAQTPIIFTEHNTFNRRIRHPLFNKIDRLIYRNYSKIVCITDEIRAIFQQQLGLLEHVFMVIRNGIDLRNITTAIPMVKSEVIDADLPDIKLLIQVSRFEPQKDQVTLIRSLKYLDSKIHLLLVGEGPLKESAIKLVAELELGQRVHFMGIRMDVPRLLKSADIVVLSTRYEGLSLSSIEGLASGRPFLGAKVPGLIDVVERVGISFECGNERNLAEVINRLFKDKLHYEATVRRCISISAEYDIYNMVRGYISLYKELNGAKKTN